MLHTEKIEKTLNLSIPVYKQNIGKSVLFSITEKRLIGSRWGFL